MDFDGCCLYCNGPFYVGYVMTCATLPTDLSEAKQGEKGATVLHINLGSLLIIVYEKGRA
jgi:hypothetical protein